MDELADYTDHQFETKLQIEIEQLTKNKQAQESPKAYLLGGQPGAGKSGLHQLIKAEDPNAITIDNDTFKWLHPKYKQLEQKYGKDVVKYVTPFSNQMTESLIDYLSDKKFDLIIEGTLRTVEVPMATVTKLQNRGYEASLYVMAVPRIESYLGTLARYEDQFSLSPRTARATSGINLDLLNDREQEDVFEDYGAFLMQTLGEGVDDSLQFLEPTIPVNMTAYLNGLKKRYLALQKEQPAQQFKIQLLASYIDHFTQVQESKNMTTKQHLLIVKVPIKDKSMTSLKLAVTHLEEKLDQVKRDLENALTDFDLTAKTLTSQEVQAILKNLINFKG